ncbi:MAG: single-stranded-DNA-specific exonuclease RecJ [Oscillospiraceae bacterium]|nr:single-stranded-DNA-specific exonuclease RecJ [Oscillospiraceae bacterium]
MEKKWIVAERDEAAEAELAERLGVPPLVAGLLRRRHIEGVEEAEAFLSPETKQAYYDPFAMKDMDRAVARIEKAIEGGERIVIYGDYDVDGITATTLLVRALSRLGANVGYYIPTRQGEGYGLHIESLERLAMEGTALVITVDCGISGEAEAEALRGRLDLVITDHHLPGDTLPQAAAVVDPHRADCAYPFKELAGVGVAFKLCQALYQKMRGEEFAEDFELVALGTVADIVPLVSENRRFVKLGLTRMKETKLAGLRALMEVTGLLDKEVTSGQVGFVLAPRLNAAGRLATAAQGAELLLAEDMERARPIAETLNEMNAERQQVEGEILEQAKKQLESADTEAARVLVVAGEGWHPGVIGIVASRLVELYYRPTVVISIRDGMGKGSCRSIAGFPLFDALTAAKDIVEQFGGHAMAAGLTVLPERIGALREALTAFAETHLTPEDYVPRLVADAELRPEDVTMELVETISRLEPYGMGNPKPVFICRDLQGCDAHPIGREGKHLHFRTAASWSAPRAVGWSMSGEVSMVNAGPVDIAYMPEIDDWNGERYVQCKLSELRPAASRRVFPTRDILARIYVTLRNLQAAGRLAPDMVALGSRCGVSGYTMDLALRIFDELGLATRDGGRCVIPPPPRQKLDLMDSDTFRRGMEGRNT